MGEDVTDEKSEILILGSFPSVKSREVNFYYGHPQNRFYKVLSRVFDEEEKDTLVERKLFLKRHKIALYDVIEECDIEGSADSTIKNVIPTDLGDILEKYSNINVIGVTGKTTEKYFKKYLLKFVTTQKIVFLPSTSPANAKMKLEDLVEKYKDIIC